MSDNPVQRAWRDTRLIRIGAGTDEIMKEVIGKSLGL
jgi:alkylation response protein AidB-like acyl-CoA dehydrogenase